jgi:hypothetical protein
MLKPTPPTSNDRWSPCRAVALRAALCGWSASLHSYTPKLCIIGVTKLLDHYLAVTLSSSDLGDRVSERKPLCRFSLAALLIGAKFSARLTDTTTRKPCWAGHFIDFYGCTIAGAGICFRSPLYRPIPVRSPDTQEVRHVRLSRSMV